MAPHARDFETHGRWDLDRLFAALATAPGIEQIIDDFEDRGLRDEAWALTQEIFKSHRRRDLDWFLWAPATAPFVERMVQGYEDRGLLDEAWALTQKIVEAHSRRNPEWYLAASQAAPFVERMVEGYEDRDLRNEAWALTQEIVETHRRKNPDLSLPETAFWVERMVEGYKDRGLRNEAWALTQEIFEFYRRKHPDWYLAAQATAPWVERMIEGFQNLGLYTEAIQLHLDVSSQHLRLGRVGTALEAAKRAGVTWESLEHRDTSMPTLCSLPNFQKLAERIFQNGYDSEINLLLQHIRANVASMPLKWKLDFLLLDVPNELRQLISSNLRQAKPDFGIISGRFKFPVHREILQYWSSYCRGLFKFSWAERENRKVILDESIIGQRSLEVLIKFMYSGIYDFEDVDKAQEDFQAVEYFGIPDLENIIELHLKRRGWKLVDDDSYSSPWQSE